MNKEIKIKLSLTPTECESLANTLESELREIPILDSMIPSFEIIRQHITALRKASYERRMINCIRLCEIIKA